MTTELARWSLMSCISVWHLIEAVQLHMGLGCADLLPKAMAFKPLHQKASLSTVERLLIV